MLFLDNMIEDQEHEVERNEFHLDVMTNRVLILGDFTFDDFDLVERELQALPEETLVVIPVVDGRNGEKNFPGAPSISRYVSEKLGYPTLTVPLIWSKQKQMFSPFSMEKIKSTIRPTKILTFLSREKDLNARKTFLRPAYEVLMDEIPTHFLYADSFSGGEEVDVTDQVE